MPNNADQSHVDLADELTRLRRENEMLRVGAPDWASPLRDLRDYGPFYIAAATQELFEDFRYSADRPRRILFGLCELVEAAARFLALVAIADLSAANEGKAPDWISEAARTHLLRPQFGNWLALIRTIAEKGTPSAFPEFRSIHEALARIVPQVSLSNPQKEELSLLEVRNSIAHGSGGSSKRVAALIDLWGPRVRDLFLSLPLSNLELWARGRGDCFLMRGPDPNGLKMAAPSAVDAVLTENGMVLRRYINSDEKLVPLRPFGRFAEGAIRAADRADPVHLYPQLYARRGEVGILYSLFGDPNSLQMEIAGDSFEVLSVMFDRVLQKVVSADARVGIRGYEDQIERDAKNLLGRAAEKNILWNAIADLQAHPQGVISLTGAAGIGKSMLVADLFAKLREELEDQTKRGISRQIVLAYRFIDGDRGCAPAPFLEWLIARLAAAIESETKKDASGSANTLRRQAEELLSKHDFDRIVLILDGVDELTRREQPFALEILHLFEALPKLLTVVSCRPEYGLPELLDEIQAVPVFKDHLPGMSKRDIRELLDRWVSRLGKTLVKTDQETDGDNLDVKNAFVEAIERRAQGLPIYVKLVAEDCQKNRYFIDGRWKIDDLPESVYAYFEILAVRGALSDRVAYGPFVGALLAAAQEPLSAAEIVALLARDVGADAVRDASAKANLTESAWLAQLTGGILLDLGGLLRSGLGIDLLPRYALFHDELKTFVLNSPALGASVAKVREILAAGARQPDGDAATPYLYRNGIVHLLQVRQAEKALGLLCDVHYQIDRLRVLAPHGGDGGIRADWDRVMRAGAEPTRDQTDWQIFWATDGAYLFPEPDADGPRDFIECALTYAPDTTVGAAIGSIDISRCQPLITFEKALRGPGQKVATLSGHTGRIIEVRELSNGHILSWSKDGTLRLWLSTGQPAAKPISVPISMNGEVGAIELSGERILSWSDGKTKIDADPRHDWLMTADEKRARERMGRPLFSNGALRIWTLDGEPVGRTMVADGKFDGAIELAGGEVLSWRTTDVGHGQDYRNAALYRWNSAGDLVRRTVLQQSVYSGGRSNSAGDLVRRKEGGAFGLSGDRLLTWRGEELIIWDANGRELGRRLHGHTGAVSGAIELRDGRILSFANDRTVRLWSHIGEPIGTPIDTSAVMEVVNTIGPTIRGSENYFYRFVEGAIELADNRILLWAPEWAQIRDDNGQLLHQTICQDLISRKSTRPDMRIKAAGPLKKGFLLCLETDYHRYGVIIAFDRDFHETQRHEMDSNTGIDGAVELSDGRILYWTHDCLIHIWDRERERYEHQKRWRATARDLVTEGGKRGWRASKETMAWVERLTRETVAALVRVDAASVASAVRTVGRRGLSRAGEDIRSFIRSSRVGVSNLLPSRVGVSDLLRGGDGFTAHTTGLVGRRLLKRARAVASYWFTQKGTVPDVLFLHRAENIKYQSPYIKTCELSNKRFLSWGVSDGLRLWSRYGEPLGPVLEQEGCGAIEVVGDRFLSWNSEGGFRLWTLDGNPIGETVPAHSKSVTQVIRLMDGHLLSLSFDGTLRLWNKDGALIGEPMRGHRGNVDGAIQLADGRLLSWSWDRTLRIWTRDGHPISRHLFWYGTPWGEARRSPGDNVLTLVFLVDGHWIQCTDQFGPLYGLPYGNLKFLRAESVVSATH
jgi:WD40 repeat protein